MTFHLLPSKLCPPTLAKGVFARPVLLERLHRGITSKAILIAAPPGFGKSTLLVHWLMTQPEVRAAWIAIDEDDNEPARFFAYLLAALRPFMPALVTVIEPLLETPALNPRDLVIDLLSAWTPANVAVALILDDYHHITAQPIHDALAYLIDHLPPELHLVFCARVDPPLPLGRWRVRGQLTEVRVDDLRFDYAESAQFLSQTMGLTLTPQQIQVLERRTEGWPAGLHLAALTLRNSADPAERIAAFAGSNRYIAEYLTDEVLTQQPEALRAFLLRTSILERLSAELCNWTLELPLGMAEAYLAELERSNIFIIPLDLDGIWYRYHHLFGELLRRRLVQTYPTELTTLHRRAAEWFERRGLLLDAVHHWIAAGEPTRVAGLLERMLAQTWGYAELAGLMRRIEALPEDVLADYPALSAFLGWTWLWLGYGSERIAPLLDRAERRLPVDVAAVRGRLDVVRSFVIRINQNDALHAVRLARQALERLRPDDTLWRGFAHLSLAIAVHACGDLLEAEAAYSETIRLCEQSGDLTTAWIAECAQIQLLFDRGVLRLALARNGRLLGRARAIPVAVRAWAHVNQARLLYEYNDLPAAHQEMQHTSELEAQTGGLPDVGLRYFSLLTQLALAQNDAPAARRAADDLVALALRGGVRNARDWAHGVRALTLFRLRDWVGFDAWVREYHPPEQPLFFPYRLATLLYLRALGRKQEWSAVRHLLASQFELAHATGHGAYLLELSILGALLEQEAGDSAAALDRLQVALGIGAADGYVRSFIDEGEPLRRLLAQAHATQHDPALRRYCGDLLAAFGPGDAALPNQQGLVEPLTRREIEILRLIAAGLSNSEIAAELVLSIGTVKTHIKHIYGKLAVDDRVSAANKGRALGIVEGE